MTKSLISSETSMETMDSNRERNNMETGRETRKDARKGKQGGKQEGKQGGKMTKSFISSELLPVGMMIIIYIFNSFLFVFDEVMTKQTRNCQIYI